MLTITVTEARAKLYHLINEVPLYVNSLQLKINAENLDNLQ